MGAQDLYGTRVRLTRDGLAHGAEFVPLDEVGGTRPVPHVVWNPATEVFEVSVFRRRGPPLVVRNLSLGAAGSGVPQTAPCAGVDRDSVSDASGITTRKGKELRVRHFPTKILLATDGSEDAGLALRAAVDLCARAGSELHVVHAWRSFPEHSHPSVAMASDSEPYEREAQEVLLGQLDEIGAAGAVAAGAHLKRGTAAETITDAARDLGAGLIVVGSRGLGPVGRLVMGSVSEGVVDLAGCPVLVVRGGAGGWPASSWAKTGRSARGSPGASRPAWGGPWGRSCSW